MPKFDAAEIDIPRHLQHGVEVPYGTFAGYELFQLDDSFVAYPCDEPRWFQCRIQADTIEELALQLDAINRRESEIGPRLVDTRHGYNILTYQMRVWVVDGDVGNVDLRNGSQIQQLLTSGQLCEARTISEARTLADKFFEDCLRESLRA